MAGSKFSLEAVLSLTDKLTGPYKNTTRKITGMNAGLSRSFNKMNQGINRGLKRITQVGLVALGAGLAFTTREFAQFDDTIVGATARFKDLEIGTDRTKAAMQDLRNTAREVGAVTQFSATEAAAGLNFFAKAGFTSAEAMAALKTQVDLATVAELDLATTSDITSDLLGALGLNASDSATKIANLEDLSNSLGIATNMANVTLTDIFETLKIGGPIATAAGADMNDLIAMTAGLGSAGIKGSQGATAIKNAYLNLATNAPKVQKALEGVGLAQEDFINQETGALDMVKAMKLLGKATQDLDPTKQVAVFNEIFGKRAIAGAVNMSKNLAEIENIISALEGDKKISAIADEIRTGLGMQLKILKSSAIELGFKFVEAFEGQGKGALDKFIKAVQNFDMKPIIEGAQKGIEIIKKWGPVLLDLTPWILGLAGAIKVLNIAMNASPIGIFLTSAAALVGSLDLLEKKFGFGQAIVEEAGGGIFSREFEENRRRRFAEGAGAERKAEESRSFQTLAARQQAAVQETRITEETRQRNDVFLHAPKGFGITEKPGDTPETSVDFGMQVGFR